MKKLPAKKILVIVTIVILAFIGWFSWEIFTEEPPQFFPFNNSEARYKTSTLEVDITLHTKS